MSMLLQDVRYAVRLLLKSPLFSALLIFILALGIGVNSAVFSIVDAVLLRPLPYLHPERVVMLWERNPALGAFIGDRLPAAYSNFLEWTRRATTFEAIVGFEDVDFNLTSSAEPERVAGARASANFFQALGVQPKIGTDFASAGDDPSHPRVALLSDAYYQSHFGGQPWVIGQRMMLNDIAYTVVGVLPKQFHLPASRDGSEQRKPDIWVPYDAADNRDPVEFNRRKMQAYGRLASGVTLDQARAELNAIASQLANENPTLNAGFGANVFPLYVEDIGQELRRNLFVLLGAVGFVLLIACANIANLMLSRAAVRGSEMAIRKALGASRGRLISQMIVESLLISLIGAGLGLFLAEGCIRLLVTLKPAALNRPEDIHLSLPALAFTAAVSILAALIFGMIPALQASRSDAKAALRPTSGARTTPVKLRFGLIVAEVALACMLLSGATLMMKSLAAVLRVDPGFRSDHLLTMKFSMPPARYPDNNAIAAFCRQVSAKAAALPGVTSASFSDGLPLTRIRMTRFTVEGQQPPARGSEPTADMRGIFSPAYFDALGMRLVAGRNFTADELDKKSPVIIVNANLARKLWPNQSPIGQHIRSLPTKTTPNPVVSTVIGVAGDTHQLSLEQETRPEITKPMADYTQLTLSVRTATDPTGLLSGVKNAVWSVDPALPMFEVLTMKEIVSIANSQRAFNSLIMGVFAVLALILAAVGIYGVLSAVVNGRTAEIGIRMALGAKPGDVLRLVLVQGMQMLALGLVLGLCGGWFLAKLLSSLLFGVDPWQASNYLEVALVILVLGVLSCLLPARRATRVNPVEALRYE